MLEGSMVPSYTPGVNKAIFARRQAEFLAGLAIVLPGIISVAVLVTPASTRS